MVKQKTYTLYYFQSVSTGLWYWRVMNSNRVLFSSQNGYTTEAGLRKAVKKIKALNFDYILIRTDGLEKPYEDLILK